MAIRKTPCDVCGCRTLRITRERIKENGIISEQYQERCANTTCNNLLFGYIKPVGEVAA